MTSFLTAAHFTSTNMWTLITHTPPSYLISISVWTLCLAVCPLFMVRLRRRFKATGRRMTLLHAMLAGWFGLGVLTAIEVGFAVLYDTTDSFSMTNVSRRWFQVHSRPDEKTLRFSDGTGITYRDSQPFPESIPDDATHICLLGDSFTFGHGVASVEDRFSNRLREKAATASDEPRPVLVSNLSYPGTDLPWVESVLQHLFEDGRRVDHAVYVMCLNDIEAFHDPRMTRSTELSRFEPPTFLFRETYFFNWAWFRIEQLSRADVQDYYSFVQGYYRGEPWQRFQARLAAVDRLCANYDCRFSVVVFPFLHNPGDDSFGTIHKQIEQSCAELRIQCIDLRAALGNYPAERLTVNPFDAHPNEQAHAIVGAVLAEQLLPRRRDEAE